MEDRLARLTALKENPTAAESEQELRRALSSSINLLAARAARTVEECEIQDLTSDLVQAFGRFMVDSAVSDKGCAAKIRIVNALGKLGAAEPDLYLQGIRHVQMEGSFGPPVDTAAELRAASAMALSRIGYPGVALELVALLADREPAARAGAVRALAFCGAPEGPLLLRLKVLLGDSDADVMAECFSALMAMDPRESLSFVAGYLDRDDTALAEAAALALGASHEIAAFEALRARWDRGVYPPFRKALLISIATIRQEVAVDFLLSLVREANQQVAAEAIESLAIYRHDEKLRDNVKAIVSSRHSRPLDEVFHRGFG